MRPAAAAEVAAAAVAAGEVDVRQGAAATSILPDLYFLF